MDPVNLTPPRSLPAPLALGQTGLGLNLALHLLGMWSWANHHLCELLFLPPYTGLMTPSRRVLGEQEVMDVVIWCLAHSRQ